MKPWNCIGSADGFDSAVGKHSTFRNAYWRMTCFYKDPRTGVVCNMKKSSLIVGDQNVNQNQFVNQGGKYEKTKSPNKKSVQTLKWEGTENSYAPWKCLKCEYISSATTNRCENLLCKAPRNLSSMTEIKQISKFLDGKKWIGRNVYEESSFCLTISKNILSACAYQIEACMILLNTTENCYKDMSKFDVVRKEVEKILPSVEGEVELACMQYMLMQKSDIDEEAGVSVDTVSVDLVLDKDFAYDEACLVTAEMQMKSPGTISEYDLSVLKIAKYHDNLMQKPSTEQLLCVGAKTSDLSRVIECNICFEESTMVSMFKTMPCMHYQVCLDCAVLIMKQNGDCAFCADKISGIIKVEI